MLKKNNFFSFLIVVVSFFVLIYLGTWQLYRLKTKNHFITSISHTLKNPVIDLYSLDDNNIYYSKVKVQGNFVNDQNIYLYGRQHDKKDGYYLLTPFKTQQGDIIMVARGWISYFDKQKIITDYSDSLIEITGLILKGEQKRTFIPDNDIKNNIWFTLDLDQIANFLQLKLKNYYLVQISSPTSYDFIKPINTVDLVKIRNDHLEYAITWYLLALILIIICLIKLKKIP